MLSAARVLRRRCSILLVATACLASPAQAQLGLPGTGGVGAATGIGGVRAIGILPEQLGLRPRVAVATQSVARVLPLQAVRRQTIDDLLRQHGEQIESDPNGEPMLRNELLLISPSADLIARAQTQGFGVLRQRALDPLGLQSVVMQTPPRLSTAAALALLRTIDPQVEADFNHVYTRSGSTEASIAQRPDEAPGGAARGRIGLVDGGVDLQHPALRAVDRRLWGCEGKPVASPHGTAVASLLVGRDSLFSGVAPSAILYSADVYCGRPGGGSVEVVAQALAWMASEGVAVINVSLVGPPNRLLEKAVESLINRGHLLVAAVGNDGPTAPPLYPAAYLDVIGVTGVSPNRRVLPEAVQGRQVVFSAPGAELAVAESSGSGYLSARGTSFAAPLVAGLLSQFLQVPDRTAAHRALLALEKRAIDLGETGRDSVFGIGLLAEDRRVEPRQLQALVRAMR